MYLYAHKSARTPEPGFADLKQRIMPLVRRTIRRGFAVSAFERLVFSVIDKVGARYLDTAPPTESAYFDEVVDGVCTTLLRSPSRHPAAVVAARETVLA